MRITVGIDVSKDTLDAYRLPDNQRCQVANDKAGHKALLHWIEKNGAQLIIFEATGIYHREFEKALVAKHAAFAKVNPRQARRFAEATGRLAKTDRVDAAMLAKMGAVLERLITCDITGFGSSGPRSHLKAYDLIVQAEAGLCSITGNSAGPARVGVSVCDIAAGMTAHSAILQALFARERTGRGSGIQISLFDAVADWMNVPFLQHVHARHETVRAGVSHPSLAPYGAFRCKDGRDVIFSVQNDREWVNFCTLFLFRPDLVRAQGFADNTARIANRPALEQIITARFTELTSLEAMGALQEAGLAYGELNDIGKLAEHPHLRTVAVETPAGSIDVIAPPAIVDGQAPSLRPLSALGQHTAAVRSEFLERRAS